VGLLRKWGRFRGLLEPGLHVRLPAPAERVTVVEPDRVRAARIGLAATPARDQAAIAWNAAHGDRRDDSALFLTGDEGLVELAAIVEYRYGHDALADILFGVAALDPTGSRDPAIEATAEAAFREALGHATLDEVLVGGRSALEEEIRRDLVVRLAAAGLPVAVDRVRILDAHPPREVVPAYRDVAAALSDAERYRNEAEGYAAEQRWSAIAEAQGLRDSATTRSFALESRASGDRDAFLARVRTRAAHPELTEFRLLWTAFADTFAGRPKLILDPRAPGRRQVWLADPDRFGLGPTAIPTRETAPSP
jgi:regulator of protease activity HflC (stomatin/prohibitin superfamily)